MKNKTAVCMLFFLLPAILVNAQDAYQLYLDGNYKEAIQILKSEIDQGTSNVYVSYYVMGWCLRELKQYDELIEQMTICLEKHGKHRRVIHVLAQGLYLTGEYQKAQEYLEDYIKMAPDGENIADVYYYLGEIFLRYKEYQHADIAFSTALYHEKNKALWWTRLGYCRQQAQNYKDAAEAYTVALRIDPGNREALKGLNECNNMLGN